MRTFFTADTHFGHGNIIRLAGRPFPGPAEMDAALLDRWNEAVAPDDTVWHLGDFAVRCKPARLREAFGALNGRKCLVVGNHDDAAVLGLGWAEVHQDSVRMEEGGRHLLLGHYPILEWDGFWRGVIHLHGHTHNSIPSTRRRADLGVEAWDYRPVLLETVLAHMAGWPDPDPRALPERQVSTP